MATDTHVIRMTLAEQVEAALRVDIMEGILAPGQRLRPIDLAQQYGVSAAALREGLQRLAAQNLIELDPRTGATVADVSESDLHEIYEMRQLLEAMAFERSLRVADAAWANRLEVAWAKLRSAAQQALALPQDPTSLRRVSIGYGNAHREFHSALLGACDSRLLVRLVESLYDHTDRYRRIRERQRNLDPIVEHELIYQPALAGRRKEAVAALKKHLTDTAHAIESGLTQDIPEA
jgi:DNA-binding GntR family transcriptional regulator